VPPDIEGRRTEVRYSYTRLAEWRRCRQRYAWKYEERIPTESSPGQIRGKCGHEALAAWYSGKTEQQALGVGLAELKALGHQAAPDRQLMEAVLKRYFAWAKRFDNWEVVAVEEELTGEIGGHSMLGYVDLIVRLKNKKNAGLTIVDHKFQKNGTVEGALLSPQLSMYAELVLQKYGELPDGVLYNVVRTTLGGQAAVTPVVRVPAQLKGIHQTWKEETARQVEEMEAFHKKGAGAPPVYRNQTNNCNWDCPFYGRCLAIDAGEYQLLRRQPSESKDDVRDADGR
jgi:hypothetical protein